MNARDEQDEEEKEESINEKKLFISMSRRL